MFEIIKTQLLIKHLLNNKMHGTLVQVPFVFLVLNKTRSKIIA